MTVAMNKDLMLAVLAMDAYQTRTTDYKIGNAKVLQGSPSNSPNGFAAVAYSYNGETIISYRGITVTELR